MDRTMNRYGRNRRRQRTSALLLVVAAVVLFCGLFAQITVRAQIAGQSKELAAVQAQIRALNAEAENLSLCINQHHNLAAIEMRALDLGMEHPTEDQLRVVSLPQLNGNASAQTVANTDGGEVNG